MSIESEVSMEVLRVKAKKDIGEVDEFIQDRIKELKAILDKDEKLDMHPESFDHFYLQCIRARKYDIGRAANLYQRFCKLRLGSNGDLLSQMRPLDYSQLYGDKFCSALPTRDALGRQVLVLRLEKWSAKQTSFEDVLMGTFLFIDEMLRSADTQLHGLVIIADLSTLSLSHVKRIRPYRLQILVQILQDSYPARFKQIHIMNNPRIFSMLYSIVQPFFTEKIRNRLMFHGHDVTSLHKSLSLDTEMLPEFLGGQQSEENYDDKSISDGVLTKTSYYEDLLKYGYMGNTK